MAAAPDRAGRSRLLGASLLSAALAAGAATGATPGPSRSTLRMAELLRRIAVESDPRSNRFMNGARARLMERVLAEEGPSIDPALLNALGEEMLNAGRTAEAIVRLEEGERRLREMWVYPRSRAWTELRMLQAIAHLRRGEEDNCVMHHNASSCLFPILPAGVHGQKRGSQEAVAILTSILRQSPGHLQARWLLNIAHMTLGAYPALVPREWLLPPGLFDSEGDIGRFPDVAAATGLDVDDLAGGSITDDFDGDGYLDVMASSMGLESQLRYFHSGADGTFTERSDEAGLTGLVGGLNVVQSDYDNDGRLDVLVLRGGWMGAGGRYPPSLLRNEGGGRFTDVTEEAGLLSFHPTQTAAWLDFDGDGWLDLFKGNESMPGDPHPCELYHNNGNGSFTECAQPAGVEFIGFVKAVTSGDFNNDGRPDLYLSVHDGPNLLYRNDGGQQAARGAGAEKACPAWRFTDVAAAAGVTEPIRSFPAWFWDYDNDGWEDIFVSGYYIADPGDIAADYLGLPHGGELPRLYRNNSDGTFADVTRAAGLRRVLFSMGSNYGDLDNDGWLDFYVGTGSPGLGMLMPNRAFRNDEGRSFQDVTTSAGLSHLQKGHVVSFADLDNDGDQDIHQVVGGAFEADHFRNALYQNPGHGKRWITLTLQGVRSNRPAIGARIEVVVRTKAGSRSIHRTVRSGGSFGASPLRQEIGLGEAEGIERVEILWPSGGIRQFVKGLELNRRYHVTEGEEQASPIQLESFRLGRKNPDSIAPSGGQRE